MKVIHHRLCISALATVILTGCSDSTPPLVGKWNFRDGRGYGFDGVMEFRADGTGSFNVKGDSATGLVWEHLEGQTPEGYQHAVQISALFDGVKKDQIKCGYKVELDKLSFGKCRGLDTGIFTRAAE
ncbi:hypothetical protein ACWGMK_00795 [Agrobacterium deltaense]